MEKMFGAYIISNNNKTLYTGTTNNLIRRIWEHKNNKGSKFAKKYNLKMFVYYDFCENMREAIIREKQIKNMSRREKLNLIRQKNPLFVDISAKLFSLCENLDWCDISHEN